MKTVLVLDHDYMGHGDAELGRKILGACLVKLNRLTGLEAVVLYNAGVKLATKDSPFAPPLHQLHEHGVDLLACGTCVEYFGLQDQMIVERISNMDEIVAALAAAEKVITL
jgi:intracellular sulfur oxidation DsrE/DsrF family protein